MLKKLLSIIVASIVVLSGTPLSLAATPTPSVKPTAESATEKLSDQINNLKEKIASRVAQLNLVEKRGIIGSVKEVSGTQITVTDHSGKNRLIDVDEITKFSSPSAKEGFGISDLKPGVKISVVGLYNKDSTHLLARFLNVVSLPLFIRGAISEVDRENFTVTIAMEEGKSYIVDIENVTKTNLYTGTDTEPEKSGFSKLEVGQRVVVVGYPDAKIRNRMVGTRILVFPSLPKNPQVVVAASAVDEVVTSSGSGKKLTPLTQP